LGWSKLSHLAKIINPQEKEDFEAAGSRQTIELRSPDGSALVHLLMAGIVLAADWGFLEDRSLKIAEHYYAGPDIINDRDTIRSFPSLPASCVESSRMLLKKKDLYLRENVFPESIIDYVIKLLQAENDEQIHQKLAEMPEKERRQDLRRILHKDLHRH
jgi:glutamine synthetase